MSAAIQILDDMVQGSEEWLNLRKTKITATDSAVIMGANPWKTKNRLYLEKTTDMPLPPPNERMQRGIDLEPIARELFIIQTGINVKPKVVVKDWTMASLDGISECGKHIVEIKCPSESYHIGAIRGGIPAIYYPQLQHQMYVCDVQEMKYFSFDGLCGVAVNVKRDDKYIERMLEEEKKFYDCLMNKIAPAADYLERNDDDWQRCAYEWKKVSNSIKELERQEEELRQKLIILSGNEDSKGSGISLCQVERKGNVDYSKVPQLKNVDLEQYRKPSSINWRITCV